METSPDKRAVVLNVKRAITNIALHLKHYLPLANAHMTDFIVHDWWEKMLPASIQSELLALDEHSLLLLPSGKFYEESRTPLVNTVQLSDTCDFCSIKVRPNEHDEADTPPWDDSLRPNWDTASLRDFVVGCQQRTLPNLGVLSPLRSFVSEDSQIGRVGAFMKEKKFHEVEIMTELCGALARSSSLNTFIDIGSGKGYLGSHLALRHGLLVLGIDSSETNTTGAAGRKQKLQAKWNQFSGQELSRRAKKSSQSMGEIPSVSVDQEQSEPMPHHCYKKSGKFLTVTEHINSDTDLSSLIADHLNPTEKCCVYQESPDTVGEHAASLCAEAQTESSDISSAAPGVCQLSSSSDKSSENHQYTESEDVPAPGCYHGYMMGGLHACGDLSANTIRLFLRNPEAKVLCNVGCCYNHLSEAYLRCPFSKDQLPCLPKEEAGFPLSQYLQKGQGQLGRNARMLAAQAPEKAAELRRPASPSLYWRALLQVILRDHTGQLRADWQVGRLAAKCKHFTEYVYKCFKKLAITEDLTEQQIEDYLLQYRPYEEKIQTFVQMKSALAPCVEGLVLLDRLLYLLEQDCVGDARLVRAFDPVKSPRCYVLLAWKTPVSTVHSD